MFAGTVFVLCRMFTVLTSLVKHVSMLTFGNWQYTQSAADPEWNAAVFAGI